MALLVLPLAACGENDRPTCTISESLTGPVARADLRPRDVEEVGYAQIDERRIEVLVQVFDQLCVGPVRERLLRAGIRVNALTMEWQPPIRLD